MSKTLEGMARTFFEELDRVTSEEAMRAALLWLADNVSDEMLNAFFNEKDRGKNVRGAIAAALRAAAGSALEAKP